MEEEKEHAIRDLEELGVEMGETQTTHEGYNSPLCGPLFDLTKPVYSVRFIHKLVNPSGFEESWEIKASGSNLPEMARQVKEFNQITLSSEGEKNVHIRSHRL